VPGPPPGRSPPGEPRTGVGGTGRWALRSASVTPGRVTTPVLAESPAPHRWGRPGNRQREHVRLAPVPPHGPVSPGQDPAIPAQLLVGSRGHSDWAHFSNLRASCFRTHEDAGCPQPAARLCSCASRRCRSWFCTRAQRSSTRSLSALQMVRTPSRSQLTRPARCSWPS